MSNKIDTSSLSIRNELVDGQGPWLWPSLDGAPGSDGGAWQGPKDDWEQHHKKNIQKYVKNFDVVVQAGGACGMYPRLYSQMFKRVYTFEPDPINFFCLANNCAETNVIKFQAALIHEHQMLKVSQNVATNVGMNTVYTDMDNGDIPGLKIDDLNLQKVDLIHLDVEGCEIYALMGAGRTLTTHKPVLMLERGNTPQINELLGQLGYKMREQSVQDFIWTVD